MYEYVISWKETVVTQTRRPLGLKAGKMCHCFESFRMEHFPATAVGTPISKNCCICSMSFDGKLTVQLGKRWIFFNVLSNKFHYKFTDCV